MYLKIDNQVSCGGLYAQVKAAHVGDAVRVHKEGTMNLDPRRFERSLTGVFGAFAATAAAAPAPAVRPPAIFTRFRCLPAQLRSERAVGISQSKVVVLVDTDAGINGIGQGGSTWAVFQ